MVHRNTYVNGPTVLAETWQVRGGRRCSSRGRCPASKGYVESAASGLLAGLNAAALANGRPASAPPRTTAIGALAYYVSHADPAHYEPSNITFGIMPPLERPPRGKMERKLAMSERALATAGDRRCDKSRRPADVGQALEGRACDRPSKAFLEFLRTEPQRVAAHGARVRERPVAVSRPRRGAQPA